jgi:hypothetical protein
MPLEQVIDVLMKLITQHKTEEFVCVVLAQTFEVMFSVSCVYTEFYLLHQFIQNTIQIMSTHKNFIGAFDKIQLIYRFMAKQNKTQAGRIATRIITEFGRKDSVLKFSQCLLLIKMTVDSVSETDFQY